MLYSRLKNHLAYSVLGSSYMKTHKTGDIQWIEHIPRRIECNSRNLCRVAQL